MASGTATSYLGAGRRLTIMMQDPQGLTEHLSPQHHLEGAAGAVCPVAASAQPSALQLGPARVAAQAAQRRPAASPQTSATQASSLLRGEASAGEELHSAAEDSDIEAGAALAPSDGDGAAAGDAGAAGASDGVHRLLGTSMGSLVVFLAVVMLTSFLGMVYIYAKGWYILLFHGREPCDQPIASWLLGCQIITPFYFARGCVRPCLYRFLCRWSPSDADRTEPCRVRVLNSAFCFFCYFLLFSGVDLVKDAKTCSTSAPTLFRWAAYLFPSGVVHFFALQVLAICSSAALLAVVSRARNDDPALAGADPSVIHKLKTVEVDETFAERQCSICLDNYAVGQLAKELHCCGNNLHEACLKEWLERRRTCPLCRADLQEITTDAERAEAAEADTLPV